MVDCCCRFVCHQGLKFINNESVGLHMQLIYSHTQLHVKCQAEKLEGKNGGVDALNKWTTEEALFFVDKNCEIKQKKC